MVSELCITYDNRNLSALDLMSVFIFQLFHSDLDFMSPLFIEIQETTFSACLASECGLDSSECDMSTQAEELLCSFRGTLSAWLLVLCFPWLAVPLPSKYCLSIKHSFRGRCRYRCIFSLDSKRWSSLSCRSWVVWPLWSSSYKWRLTW